MTQRVLITGAGSGLGRALALRFAADGARIACTDRDPVTAAETLALITREGGQGLSFALDVTDEQSFIAAAERVQAEWGGVDVVVNNAGVAVSGAIEATPIRDWEWVFNINVLGVVRGCKTFAPLFKGQKSGHFVNIASFAGIANPPAMGAYNVAKAGVVSLSETLRLELCHWGVGVTVVCPAFFPTNLMNSARVQEQRTVGMVHKLMKNSGVTAESVAGQIVQAVNRKQFLVLTHKDTRTQALIKRASPELFFKVMRKATAKMFKMERPTA